MGKTTKGRALCLQYLTSRILGLCCLLFVYITRGPYNHLLCILYLGFLRPLCSCLAPL